MTEEVPRSRRAGRMAWRLWDRHGRPMSEPVRKRWSVAAAYGWFVAYCWIGLLLSVAGNRLLSEPGERQTSPLITIISVAGGGILGYWQARHRMTRHADPATPLMRFFPLAVSAWLAAIGLAILISL